METLYKVSGVVIRSQIIKEKEKIKDIKIKLSIIMQELEKRIV